MLIVEGLWKELEDFPYPQRYKCGIGKSEASETKPKFGMYYGVPAHKECGLPVSTLGIIQGGLHSEGVHTIYAQDVRDIEGGHHWITTKTCAWCSKAFYNGESVINHMHVHYKIVLVCSLCGKWDSHSYSSMRDHVKKCKDVCQELLAVMEKPVCTNLVSIKEILTCQRRV